jgi:hypothetical protein
MNARPSSARPEVGVRVRARVMESYGWNATEKPVPKRPVSGKEPARRAVWRQVRRSPLQERSPTLSLAWRMEHWAENRRGSGALRQGRASKLEGVARSTTVDAWRLKRDSSPQSSGDPAFMRALTDALSVTESAAWVRFGVGFASPASWRRTSSAGRRVTWKDRCSVRPGFVGVSLSDSGQRRPFPARQSFLGAS